MADIQIGATAITGKLDGGTPGLISGLVELAQEKGIKIKGNKSTITNGENQVAWGSERAQIVNDLEAYCKSGTISKPDLAKTLTALNTALDPSKTSGKYNLAAIRNYLKGKELTLDQIAKLKGKADDALIEALLKELGLDPAQFQTDQIKSIQALKTLLTKSGVTVEEIETHPAYEYLADISEGSLKPTKKNIALLTQAKTKIEQIKGAEIKKIAREKETAKKITSLKTQITQATTLLALQNLCITNKDTFDSDTDGTLAKAVSKHALELLRNGKTLIKKKELERLLQLGLIRPEDLGPGEVLIAFTEDGTEYVVIAKKDTVNNQWTLLGLPEQSKYYLEEDENGNLVVKMGNFGSDPTFETKVLAKQVADPKKPHLLPRAGRKKAMYIPASNLIIEWMDTTPNGIVDLDEKDSVIVAQDKDNDQRIDEEETIIGEKKLSKELFTAMANGMLMPGEGAGDTQISLEESQHAAKVILEFANIMGYDLKEALTEYNTSELGNVNFGGLRKAKEKATADLDTIKNLKPEQARVKLEELGYKQDMIDQILKGLAESKSAKEIAEALLKLACEALKEQNTAITYQAIISFWKTEYAPAPKSLKAGHINNPDTARRRLGKAENTLEDRREWYQTLSKSLQGQDDNLAIMYKIYMDEAQYRGALAFIQQITDPARKNQALTSLSDKLTEQNKLKFAFEVAKEIGSEEGKEKAFETIFNLALKSSKINLAHEIADQSPASSKIRRLALVAAECLKSKDQPTRERAVTILEQIVMDNPTHVFAGQEDDAPIRTLFAAIGRPNQAKQGMNAQELLAVAKQVVAIDPKIWFIGRDYLEPLPDKAREAEEAGKERIKLTETAKSDPAATMAKIIELETIMKNDSLDQYTETYARYTRATLLFALAVSGHKDTKYEIEGKQLSAEDVYKLAMKELEQCFDTAIEQATATGEPKFLSLAKQSYYRMVDIVDYFRNSRKNSPKEKALIKELQARIPDYAGSMPYVIFSIDGESKRGHYSAVTSPADARHALKLKRSKPRRSNRSDRKKKTNGRKEKKKKEKKDEKKPKLTLTDCLRSGKTFNPTKNTCE